MPGEKIVAIHQPTFFPWLGFFDKIIRADIFILLNNVQFPKKGGSWINRVQLISNGQAAWVTMPVVRSFHGTRLILEMRIDNTTPWRDRIFKTIQTNYSHAPFFERIYPLFKELLFNPADNLADYNEIALRALADLVGIDTSKIVISSKLDVPGAATDRLIALTQTVGGGAYLCGGGAAGYQEDFKFSDAGLKLIYQDYKHPIYKQYNTDVFVPGLSIIDSLMNLGPDGVRAILYHISD